MISSEYWHKLEEVFEGALDIPREQREAWLTSACGGDDRLRREVKSLLDTDPGESGRIAGIIEGTAASLFGDDAPPDAMAGQNLGNYRIIRELGRGGMGAVYLAVRSDETFDKQVAIKLVKRGIDTDAVLQRFWYERRILAGLEHPYIARLVDGGTSPDGRPYFVMEYVDGKPLDVYVREQNLSIEQRCELVCKICEAVSYAHRNLIIHRDLKPGNVLVTADGTPKLLDFGIARLLSSDSNENTLTGPVGPRALTPEFASPEQARGDAVTTATDVYSLGATLRAILPADKQSPGDLITIIKKATREEIDQRYASVAEFREDLRRFLAGLPIMAREQTLLYQAGKFVRRHRLGVAVFVLANTVGMAGIAAIIWESHKAETQRRQAEQRLSQAVDMAERTLANVNTSIASVPGTTDARRQMVRSTLDYLDRLARDSGDNPRVIGALATAYMRVGEVLGNSDVPNLGDLPGSLATYQKALGLIKGLLEESPNELKLRDLAAQAHQGEGNVLASLGRGKDAEQEVRTAMALADGTLARSPEREESQTQSLDAHFALAMLRYTADPKGIQEDAKRQLPLARKMAETHPDDLTMQEALSEYYAMMGTTSNRMNRLQESAVYYRQAVQVREAIFQKSPRNTRYQRSLMIGYGHVGDVLGNPFTGCLGDYRGALEYFQKAERIAEDMSRADPYDNRARYDMGMIWARIGATQRETRDLISSHQSLDRAIANFEGALKSSPGNVAYSRGIALALEYRAHDRWDQGDEESAISDYRRSLAIADKLLASAPTDLNTRTQRVSVMGRIATLMVLSGHREGAVRMSEQAVREAKDNAPGGGTRGSVAMAQFWLGRTYEALNDFPSAAVAYADSLETWRKISPALTGTFAAMMHDTERRLTYCKVRGRR